MQALNQTVVASGLIYAAGTTRDATEGVPDGPWWDGEAEDTGDGLFDPAKHNQGQVIEYLEREDVDDEERARVVAAEAEGKARKGVREWAEAYIAERDKGENPSAPPPGDADGS